MGPGGPVGPSSAWGQPPGNQLALVSPTQALSHNPYMPTMTSTGTVYTTTPYGTIATPAPAPAPVPAQPPVAPAATPGMPTHETIQLMVDERQYKTQIDGKLNTLVAKVDQLSDRVAAVAKSSKKLFQFIVFFYNCFLDP